MSFVSIIFVSYMLSHEYKVVRNRYTQLVFTNKDCLCTNLHVQEQSMNMTSQCQYLGSAWRHRSTVVTSQCSVRKDRPWQQWLNGRSLMVFSGIVCWGHKIACKKENNTSVTVNNDFSVSREVICQWFSLVTLSLMKIIGKSPHLPVEDTIKHQGDLKCQHFHRLV